MPSAPTAAILLGASRFRDPELDLENLARANELWSAYLVKTLEVDEKLVLDLFDSEKHLTAQLSEIEEFLGASELANGADRASQATIIVSYTGHGCVVSNEARWLLRDTRTNGKQPEGALDPASVRQMLERLENVRVIWIVDACFARSSVEQTVPEGGALPSLCFYAANQHETASARGPSGTRLMSAVMSVLARHSGDLISPRDLFEQAQRLLRDDRTHPLIDPQGGEGSWDEGFFVPQSVTSLPRSSRKVTRFLTTAWDLGLLTRFQAQHIANEARLMKSFGKDRRFGETAIGLGYMSHKDVSDVLIHQRVHESRGDVLSRRAPRRVTMYLVLFVGFIGASYWWLGALSAWTVFGLVGWLSLMGILDAEEPHRPVSSRVHWSSAIRLTLVAAWLGTGAWATVALNDHVSIPAEQQLAPALASWSLLGGVLVASGMYRRSRVNDLRRYLLANRDIGRCATSNDPVDGVLFTLLGALRGNRWIKAVDATLNVIRRVVRIVTFGTIGRTRDFAAINIVLARPDGGCLRVTRWLCQSRHNVENVTKVLEQNLSRPITDTEWFREQTRRCKLEDFLARADRYDKVSLVGSAYAYRRTVLMEDSDRCWSFGDRFLEVVPLDTPHLERAESAMAIRSGVVVPVPPNCERPEEQFGVLAVYRNLKNGLTREDMDLVLSAARALATALRDPLSERQSTGATA